MMRKLSLVRIGASMISLAILVLAYQNCSSNWAGKGNAGGIASQGGGGVEGMRYVHFGICAGNVVGIAEEIDLSQNRSTASLSRHNCQLLAQPQSINVDSLQFAAKDSAIFQLNGQVFDQQVETAGQKVTLELCQSPGLQPAEESAVWQILGNTKQYFGSVTLANGSTTGSLNLMPPASSMAEFVSQTGQSGQLDLLLGSASSASMTYTIGNGTLTSVPHLTCAAQSAPAIPDDGSSSAPTGAAQHPALLKNYLTRPGWKVAGVDYHVGIPDGEMLKDPLSDPALAAMPNVTVNVSNTDVSITGDNVTLDGYDFSLHGGVSITVRSGNNTIVRNSKISYVATFAGTNNLTINNCLLDGSDNLSGGWALVYHLGGGLLTIEHNWIRNYPEHAVESDTGGSVVYRYNLIEAAGLRASAGTTYLQLTGGQFPSVVVEFNTTYQVVEASAGEGFQFYNTSGGAITGDVAYNTMIAIPKGARLAMNFLLHIGGGKQYPGKVNATIHDNYMDASGAISAFYGNLNDDGNTAAVYSNNFDLVAVQPLTTNP